MNPRRRSNSCCPPGPPASVALERSDLILPRFRPASNGALFSRRKDLRPVRLAEKAFKTHVAGNASRQAAVSAAARSPAPTFPSVRIRDSVSLSWRAAVAAGRGRIARVIVRLGPPLNRATATRPWPCGSIKQTPFDCLLGGARRDEERSGPEASSATADRFFLVAAQAATARAVTLSTRLKTRALRAVPTATGPSSTSAVHRRERIPLPGLYYSHPRQVVRRKGLLVPVTAVTPPAAGETIESLPVRFRTVGDMTCTCPVESEAANAVDVVAETLTVTVSERGATRMDDNPTSMEKRKKEVFLMRAIAQGSAFLTGAASRRQEPLDRPFCRRPRHLSDQRNAARPCRRSPIDLSR